MATLAVIYLVLAVIHLAGGRAMGSDAGLVIVGLTNIAMVACGVALAIAVLA